MRTRHHLTVLPSLLAATALWSAAVWQASAASPVVIHDVQASTDPYDASTPPGGNQSSVQPNTEVEPSIAVNPGDPQDVVTDFQEGRVDAGGDADNGFGASLDGGATWTYGNLPGLTKAAPNPTLVPHLCPTDVNPEAFDRASDAVVTFGWDPTGKAHGGYIAYAQSLVFDDSSCSGLPSGMAINLSYDGGLTWTQATILEYDPGGGLNDKNWITVDNGSGVGHHRGRVYVVWDRVDPVVYAYCDPDSPASAMVGTGCDKQGNWTSVHNNTFLTLYPGQGIGTMPVVLNNGDLGIMFTSLTSSSCSPEENPQCGTPGNSNIVWQYIAGAGSTPWGSPLADPQGEITVATYYSNGITKQRAGSLPQVTQDPVTGDVFIVWEDNRFRTDGGATPGPSDASNQNDPVFSMSKPTAGGIVGVTWSNPARIDASAPTNDYVDRYNTTVAIGQDGLVRVAYRQRDENPAHGFNPSSGLGTGIDTYYQQSTDQGTTWSAPLKVDVTQGTPDASFGAFSRGGLFEGDYEQIAAGASGESFVTRDEAWNHDPSLYTAPCPTGFTTIEPCQWQQTWVALIGPTATTATPDARFVPGLALAGIAGASLWLARRRRSSVSDRS